MFNRKLIEALKQTINSLEDENLELKRKNGTLEKDNIILLENEKELRQKINGLENILESYAEKEMQENKPKRRGRPKKEAN